ncbi:hypothetical protein [Rothia sp. ZJ932]|uniref:hypothetical protein n=1 Tax=Rothia sp. ZJ932 TaxID=2810516 RepID=UPI001967A029|nr:hypothetical protein [Rothia sp. ZJ932]QRZ61214.1 hypothetical protein JR346_08165 [Rothia sp. ZJ932]
MIFFISLADALGIIPSILGTWALVEILKQRPKTVLIRNRKKFLKDLFINKKVYRVNIKNRVKEILTSESHTVNKELQWVYKNILRNYPKSENSRALDNEKMNTVSEAYTKMSKKFHLRHQLALASHWLFLMKEILQKALVIF